MKIPQFNRMKIAYPRFQPTDRERFQSMMPMKQAYKELMLGLKIKSIEDDFQRWNRDFLELTDCLEVREYITKERPYPTTHERLCDKMADGDEEVNVQNVLLEGAMTSIR